MELISTGLQIPDEWKLESVQEIRVEKPDGTFHSARCGAEEGQAIPHSVFNWRKTENFKASHISAGFTSRGKIDKRSNGARPLEKSGYEKFRKT